MLLSVRGLRVCFGGDRTECGRGGGAGDSGRGPAAVRAVDGVDIEIDAGRTAVVVGESGSGKSATALALMGLLPPAGRTAGQALFEGRDLLSLPPEEMRRLRGRRLGMIFQEPMTSLNPVMPVGRQIVEGIRLHESLRRRTAQALAVEMLRRVGIPAAERRMADYPHQLSGGMRQRVMIAMALACGPSLLIADEPTTALDVTTQAQILALLRRLGREMGMALLFITHDLGVAASVADDVYVMYAGRIVERAPAARLFAEPRHPYTQALLRCAPRPGRSGAQSAAARSGSPSPAAPGAGSVGSVGRRRSVRLEAIPGAAPARPGESAGCRFEPRCAVGSGEAQCREREPEIEGLDQGQAVACWKVERAEAGQGP